MPAQFSLNIDSSCRSSRSQMFFNIVVLKNFAIFSGKHLRWSLFLIKLQAWTLSFINKRLQHRCFLRILQYFYKQLLLQNISSSCFWIASVMEFPRSEYNLKCNKWSSNTKAYKNHNVRIVGVKNYLFFLHNITHWRNFNMNTRFKNT